MSFHPEHTRPRDAAAPIAKFRLLFPQFFLLPVGRGNVPMLAVYWAFALLLARDAQSLHHTHHRHRIPQVTTAGVGMLRLVSSTAISRYGNSHIVSRIGFSSASRAAAASVFILPLLGLPRRTPRRLALRS